MRVTYRKPDVGRGQPAAEIPVGAARCAACGGWGTGLRWDREGKRVAAETECVGCAGKGWRR